MNTVASTSTRCFSTGCVSGRRWQLCALLAVLICPGCSIRGAAIDAGAELTSGLLDAVLSHPDPQLVEQGMPTLLLVIDGLLESEPDNPRLLLAATEGYSRYCQAFLTSDADAARSARLYARARDYGLRLLRQHDFFDTSLNGSWNDYQASLAEFTEDDVPAVHAAAAAWLGWIIADSDSMTALADLPRALELMKRAMELDESYAGGGGHLVFGIYYAVQPRGAGQNLELSRRHFQRATELGGAHSLLPRVLFAEYWARATLDRELFVSELQWVVARDPDDHPSTRLLNQLAQERARELLAQTDDLF